LTQLRIAVTARLLPRVDGCDGVRV